MQTSRQNKSMKLPQKIDFHREDNGYSPNVNCLWQLKDTVNELIDYLEEINNVQTTNSNTQLKNLLTNQPIGNKKI